MSDANEPNQEFEQLLDYLKNKRNFDFSGYKRKSLMRRIQKRMQMMDGVDSYADYIHYLEANPDEFIHLFNTILINVTSFFRDRDAWEYMAEEIVPDILHKKPTGPIRIWSAACASGEESFTLAMLFADALGMESFRERVKIYATDVDEEALQQARHARYSAAQIEGLDDIHLQRYFDKMNGDYVFHSDLRRSVIFGRHDLMQDAPISRIDLLVCRNVLMYFNIDSQRRILSRFHFALLETGYLFVGKAEMLYTHSNLFTPVDMKRRVFRKVPQHTLRAQLLSFASNSGEDNSGSMARHVRLRELAFDISPTAQVVVDLEGNVVLANQSARSLLMLTTKDLYRPLNELEFFNRLAELRNRIREAYAEGEGVNLNNIDWLTTSGDVRSIDIQVNPMRDLNGATIGLTIVFMDNTASKRLQEKLESTNQDLETAYEELQSTNEELETTNEELQSTIEELETTNEELQSTNEELETINEELQSTNEEMQTVNIELRSRTDELNEVNAFLASILSSMPGGVVVVNADLQVQVWSSKAEALWGLRSDEVNGSHFFNLDIGLPVMQLRESIRNCLNGQAYQQLVLSAVNRRGRNIMCQVTVTPLTAVQDGRISGVIMMMEAIDEEKAAE